MKKFAKLAAVVLTCIIGMGLAACGKPNVPEGFTSIAYICSGLSGNELDYYQELVDTYNSTQGKEDKVYVDATYILTEYAQYDSELNRNTKYSLANITEAQIKGIATSTARNGFVNLDTVLTDDMKTQMGFDTIPSGMLDAFRVDSTLTNGKYNAGEGAALLGVPISANPHVLYYNPKILKDNGINIVHVGEKELDAYNTANGASLAPCGYAEYLNKPFETATSTKNANGETVYRVFNDRIPMSWAEQRIIARTCQKEFGYTYGYMSEFWYNYGWSVGGDCIVWDDTKNNYTLSLGDKYSNYIADAAVVVNGTQYAQGDVIGGENSLWLSRNESELAKISDKLIEIPSMYEAFVEFNRLGVPTTSNVDAGYPGYGVAPNSTVNRNAYFLTGNNCPFLVDDYSLGPTFSQSAIKNNWDVAPLAQYREYDGGETYYKDNDEGNFQKEYLKVIGKEYDNEVYTGALRKTENGTKVVGRATTASYYKAIAIPSKCPANTQEAALKFISWAAGEEGQKIICKSGIAISNHPEYNMSDEYLNSSSSKCNSYAAALMSFDSYVGDYSYFNSHAWIDNWSATLNGVDGVRGGVWTLQEFLYDGKVVNGEKVSGKLEQANKDLSNMNIRIKGR